MKIKITLINYLIDPCPSCQGTTRYPSLLLMALHELSNWLNFNPQELVYSFGGFGPLVKNKMGVKL